MIKWKCHNCGNEFETEGDKTDAYSEFGCHVENCFNVKLFFEIIK